MTQETQQPGTHCTNCGASISEGSRFCDSCGNAIAGSQASSPAGGAAQAAGIAAIVCPSCNRQTILDRRFCPWCTQFVLHRDGVLRYAGFGKRLSAYLLDFVVPYISFFVLLTFLTGAAAGADNGGAGLAVLILFPLAWVAVQFTFWSKGTSLGKSLLGVRVIHSDGHTVGFWPMFVREFVAKGIVVTVVSVFTLGIGWLVWHLWALWDKDSQALHDKFISSFVVSEAVPGP